MKRILLSWSSGKDSAWALHVLRQRGEYEVASLLTTINATADRVAMHGVRRELLQAQASAAGLPLWTLPLPWPCSNDDYDRMMAEACKRARAEGMHGVAFGDLFLEDIRAYRIKNLAGTGLEPIFPIWGRPTDKLAHEMIAGGLRARLTCVDTKVLPAEFSGREFDDALLMALRERAQCCGRAGERIDPCGENGEFHTFCYDGPMFTSAIPIIVGETVLKERFSFADLKLWELQRDCIGSVF